MAFLTIVFLAAIIWVIQVMMVILAIASVVLQFVLSRLKYFWIGLILPGLAFGFALLAFCIGVSYDLQTAFLAFAMVNVPTAIYLIIYGICRLLRRRRRRKELASS